MPSPGTDCTPLPSPDWEIGESDFRDPALPGNLPLTMSSPSAPSALSLASPALSPGYRRLPGTASLGPFNVESPDLVDHIDAQHKNLDLFDSAATPGMPVLTPALA